MKTTLKKVAFIAVAVMLYTSSSNAQNNNTSPSGMTIYSGSSSDTTMDNEEQNGVMLTVVALSNNSTLRDATIKLYHENQLVVVLNSSIQYKMELELKRNSHYMLEVFSPGYTSKSVMISTAFPADSLNMNDATIYEHAVSVSLTKRSKNDSETAFAQFSGIVCYDPERDIFMGFPLIQQSENKEQIIAQLEAWLGSEE